MSTATLVRLETPPAEREAPASLDLRSRRDVQGRRLQRVALRRAARAVSLVLLDAGCVVLAGLATTLLRGHDLVLTLLPLLVALSLLGQTALRTYGPSLNRRCFERIVAGLLLVTAVVGVLDLSYPGIELARLDYLTFTAAAGLFLCGARWLADRAIGRIYRRGIAVERMLVIGVWEDEWLVRERHRVAEERGVEVIGHITPRWRNNPNALGTVEHLSEILEKHAIDRVVISARLEPKQLREVVRECFLHGASVSVVPEFLDDLECRISSRSVLGWPMLEIEVPRLHVLQLLLKRTVDMVAAAIGILLLAPLFLGLALAIKLDSPGPVFFRQRRLGVGGSPFRIIKFRSMRADAEKVLRADARLYQKYLDNDFKLPPEEDPRVTRLGCFLRRSSLDELPQLLNVLLGDMSLVGPRPIVPDEIKEYGEHATTFLGVRPGVTGYWQVSGRSSVGYPERAELDINYILGWSLLLDLKILALTIPAVLWARGAH